MLRLTTSIGALAAFLLFAMNAQALTITPSATTTDSASFDNGDSGGTQSATSGSAATISDELGGSAIVTGQYDYQVWGDTWGGNEDATYNHELTVVFNVLADAGVNYDITFSTARLGAMGLADDTWSNSTVYSSAHLGALSGTINGTTEAGLSLGAQELDSGDEENEAIDQLSTGTTLSGSGDSTWTVVTSWTSRVTSNYDESGISLGNSISPGLMGELDISAGPNDGVDTIASLTITAIPEPSTALLMGLGLAGFASLRRKRVQR